VVLDSGIGGEGVVTYLITVDDVVLMDSTTMHCSACGTTIAVDPEPDGELTALSVQEAFDIAAAHVRDNHR
jgi:hypothetical protein